MLLRGFIVLVLGGLAGAASLAWLAFSPTPAVKDGPLVVEIPAHEGVLGIAGRLAEADVVPSRMAFLAMAAGRGRIRHLKAGEYEIPRGATTLDGVDLLASGRVRQHVVLHPEGATIAELARLLENARLARAEDIIRAASDEKLLRTLDINGPSLEGYLFPDTYQFV